jgi:hypothetical protein
LEDRSVGRVRKSPVGAGEDHDDGGGLGHDSRRSVVLVRELNGAAGRWSRRGRRAW